MNESSDWISVKEAWVLYGCHPCLDTFRRKFCGPGGILEERHGLRVRKAIRRVVLVHRQVIIVLVEEERGLTG